MRKIFQTPILAIAAASVLAGCGTSTTGGGGGGGTGGTSGTNPIAAADLPKAVEDAMCTVATTCGDAFEFSFSTVENCKLFAAASGEFGNPDELIYVSKGTVEYDGQKAAECLAAMKAQCGFENEPEACDLAFQGKLELDAACENDVECKGDAACVTDDLGCNGTCKALAAEGESCKDIGCKSGLVCDYQSDKCVVEKIGAEGDDCDTNECGTGLFCDYNNGGGNGVPKCRKLGAEGENCDYSEQCVEGLACAEGKCAKPIAANEACTDPGETAICAAGHVCGVIGKMTDKVAKCLPVAKVGEACTSHMQCVAMDLYCKGLENGGTAGTCSTLPQLGEDCTPPGIDFPQFFACVAGFCDKTSKKCVPALKKGAACGEGIPCGNGLDCDDDGTGKQVCVEETSQTCQ